MGRKIGYARIGNHDKDIGIQIDELKAAGCSKIFTDQVSGAKKPRPGFDNCMKTLKAKDTLVVCSLNRLSLTVSHLISIFTDLNEKKIGLKSLQDEGVDTAKSGELLFNIFTALSRFEKALFHERSYIGLSAARARGKDGGRKQITVNNPKVVKAKKMHADTSIPIQDICDTLKISRATLYRYLSVGSDKNKRKK